jgi:hypothetical protein
MRVQASQAAQVRIDVRIEIFTVIWIIVEAAVSMLVLFPPAWSVCTTLAKKAVRIASWRVVLQSMSIFWPGTR